MKGRACNFGAGDPRELASPDDWGGERTIRGHALAGLLMHVGAGGTPSARQVVIQGARVTGEVDMSHAEVAVAARFVCCLFDDGVFLWLTRTRTIQFETCELDTVDAVGASVEGFLEIKQSKVRRAICLAHAEVSHSVDLSGSRISGNSGPVLNADGLEVGGNVFLNTPIDGSKFVCKLYGFHAKGEVRLSGTRIAGQLICSGGRFENPDGVAITLDHAEIGRGVFLNNSCNKDKLLGKCDSFHATGEVRMLGARIGSDLDCSGGRFEKPKNCALDSDVRSPSDLTAREVTKRSESYALRADGANISGPVSLASGFHATGAVWLVGAQIGGVLNCSGGRFDNAAGYALAVDGAEIGGSVLLSTLNGGSGRFYSTGTVLLMGARIYGQVNCAGGRFENSDGCALSAESAQIGVSVLLRDGFCATGEVKLSGAQIGGQLSCSGGRFESSRATALNLQHVQADSLWLRDASFETGGLIDLLGAQVSLLIDDPETLGEKGVALHLDGFVYERIAPDAPRDAATRLLWLERQPKGCHPQPFDQLAAVFRRNGQDQEARDVLVAKRRKRRRDLKSHERHRRFGALKAWVNWLWDAFLDRSVLYGWQPWRPLLLGGAIFLISFVLVSVADAKGYVDDFTVGALPYTSFIHTLDVFLPIVDLGVESHWMIDTSNNDAFAWLVMWFLWALKLVGWGTVTLALAALTGIVKRE